MNFDEINREEIKHFYLEKNTDTEKYILYRKLFTEYIIDKLNLKKYDDELKNSELNFIPIQEEKMDIYQYFSSDILKYFYIRNNLYIEKLDKDAIDFIEQRIKAQEYNLDKIARDIIERTYRNVLFKDKIDGFKTFVFYGPDSMSFSADSEAVVIGVRYDEFNLNGMNDDDWDNNFVEQQKLLFKMLTILKYEFEEILNNPVAIIKYNEYSVIPRTKNNIQK